MKTIMLTQTQQVPFSNWNTPPERVKRLSRAIEFGWNIVVEACETVAGVFATSLRHAPYDQSLGQLDDHLLKDIGYARTKARTFDV